MARESAQAYKTPERDYDIVRGQRAPGAPSPPPKTEFERAVRGSKSIFERSAMVEKLGGLQAREGAERYQGHQDAAAAAHAMQTGVRGGQFYISPSGAKVYKKENPGWVAEDPAKPDLVEPYKLGGNGPWKTG